MEEKVKVETERHRWDVEEERKEERIAMMEKVKVAASSAILVESERQRLDFEAERRRLEEERENLRLLNEKARLFE